MINRKRKGANAEREISELFRWLFGCELVRNLDQPRSGGSDLVVVNVDRSSSHYVKILQGFSIEIKRYARVSRSQSKEFWLQAYNQAKNENRWPMLIIREDFRNPIFYIPLAYLGITAEITPTPCDCLLLDVVGLASLFDHYQETQRYDKRKPWPQESANDI